MARPVESTEVVASRRNPILRRIARLDQETAYRRKEGAYLLWGWNLVEEALREPTRLERLILGVSAARRPHARPLLRRAHSAGLPTTRVEDSLLDRLIPGAGDQGVLAIARILSVAPETMIEGRRDPVLVIADRVQDPGNLGTILRVAEAAGVSGVGVVPGTVDPYHTRSVRASSGAVLRLPIARIPREEDFRSWCRQNGIRILVSLPSGGLPCHRADLTGPLALVLGNEGEGVSTDWIRSSEVPVTVPLMGSERSLNVALAAAILLYEMVRQRSS